MPYIEISNIDEWENKKATEVTGGNARKSGNLAEVAFADKSEGKSMRLNEEVQIVEKAPAVFQAIRKMDGVTDEMIQDSLDVQKNRKQVFRAKESAGKSGSFFFFSHDSRFLLKTMNDREMKVMDEALVDYFTHFKNHPNSLLARIYGIFTVRMEELVPVHILLMQNSAQCNPDLIEYVFDLKGSEANRFVPEAEQKRGGTLKCMNLLAECKENILLLWQRQDVKAIND